MQDLQLIGVHEDGEHLLLSGPDDEHFRLPVDEALRAAVRRDRPRLGQQQIEMDGGLRPRDVQALIRAGASTEEAASRAGWTVEKVHRYEGPILAEREHVAGLAQRARLRTRNGVYSGGGAPTLSARVAERLKSRDVEVTDTSWDSWRAEAGPWTVVLTFVAGGRQRQASWSFDLADRTVSAVDDEARWLSEEVQTSKGPIPAPKPRPAAGRDTTVYDVEAEGGLHPAAREDHQEDPLDLMTAMRKRSAARGRRRPGGHGTPRSAPKTAASVPEAPEQEATDQALPLDDLDYDARMPDTADAQASPGLSRVLADHGADGRAESGTPALAEPADDELTQADSSAKGSPPRDTSSDTGDESQGAAEGSAPQAKSTGRAKRPARETTRKTGRPSVPAWDEIMFGSRPDADRSSS
ncbi:MAG TPA: septation protein SepH [Dermatophilaceae bacterium]|nr:septation protein SepH [Dermatophilaceae bacterium]